MKNVIVLKIRGYHADMFGHVNHARYLELMEEGRWSYCEEKGLFDLFHQKRIGHVVVNITVSYRQQTLPGNKIRIETSLVETGTKSVTFLQEIYLDQTDTLLADARIKNVYFDMNTGNSLAVNPDLIRLWPDLAKTPKQISHGI